MEKEAHEKLVCSKKTVFATPEAAQYILDKQKQKYTDGRKLPIAYYTCKVCGMYHLTSKPRNSLEILDEKNAIIEKMRSEIETLKDELSKLKTLRNMEMQKEMKEIRKKMKSEEAMKELINNHKIQVEGLERRNKECRAYRDKLIYELHGKKESEA